MPSLPLSSPTGPLHSSVCSPTQSFPGNLNGMGPSATGRAVGPHIGRQAGKAHSSKPHHSNAHKVTRLVGKPMESNARINGQDCKCLLDTGSQVTTLPVSYYKANLQHVPLQDVDKCFRIEAANGQSVPYLGCIEVELELPGALPKSNKMIAPILVVKDTPYNKRVPLTLGTNVILTCMEKGKGSSRRCIM